MHPQGASWSGDCAGQGPRCAHVLTASQFDPLSEALDAFGDALLDGRTYRWLRYQSGYMGTAAASFVDFPDAAVIPSLIAQAFQQVGPPTEGGAQGMVGAPVRRRHVARKAGGGWAVAAL